jgi:integrase
VRAVPLAPDVATALAQVGNREHFVGDDDLVFVEEAGGYLDGSALRRRYKVALQAAGLRPLRMGHADIQTTMRYLHYAPRQEDAELVAEAFRIVTPETPAVEAVL